VPALDLILGKELRIFSLRTDDVFLNVELTDAVCKLTDCLSPVDLADINWELALLICRHKREYFVEGSSLINPAIRYKVGEDHLQI
jgi:hypothetical protein